MVGTARWDGAVVFGAATLTRAEGDGGLVVGGAVVAARVVLVTGVLGAADVVLGAADVLGAGGTVAIAAVATGCALLAGVPVPGWL